MLVRLLPGHAEAEGLLALLLSTQSRRAARRGPAGELIPLDEQDRDRWDRARIAEGTALVATAIARGAVGTYQLQAAIAALHAEAPDIERTDWAQILALYTLLLQITGSPVVALNRAVAVAMVDGPRAALAEVERLAAEPQLAMGHRSAAGPRPPAAARRRPRRGAGGVPARGDLWSTRRSGRIWRSRPNG